MVALRVEPELLARIDAVARLRGHTRTVWMTRALARSLRVDEDLFDLAPVEETDARASAS